LVEINNLNRKPPLLDVDEFARIFDVHPQIKM
jgi:hypothetical protein